ncbi:MAG: hypothetical protein WDA75_14670 [Candidatus Latescibacterota bacterium]|jgi:hypothetical protein
MSARLGLLLVACGLGLAGCQDSRSPLWTVAEVHQGVGLVGGHQQMDCADCHKGSGFAGVDQACETCHLDQYSTTRQPNHLEAGYATTCADCHTSRSWRPARVDHARLGFPLEGAHARAVCAACHRDGTLGPLPKDCWSCHGQDYLATTDPSHQELAFARECEECHGPEAWRPAVFDHATTGFVLTGAHATAGCAACHAEGRFAGTPADCGSCHEGDAPADHFGPQCADCHGTVAWRPSTFDHEAEFPLRRGSHQRYRDRCASCHLERPDYSRFTCTECHDGEHDRRSADRDHREVQRYTYESTACYQCHPRGSGEGAEGD